MLERAGGRAKAAWISGGGTRSSRENNANSSTGMYGFLSGLVQFGPVAQFLDVLAPRRFQVLVTGLEAVGKTAVLDTLAGRSLSFAERPPRGRHGFNMARAHLSGAEVTLVEADPEDLSAVFCTDGVIVVVDTLREDGEDLPSLLRRLTSAPQLARRPLLILCNKQDLEDATPPPSILFDALRLDSLTEHCAWRLQGCCTQLAFVGLDEERGALDERCAGVHAGFAWLVQAIRQRLGSDSSSPLSWVA